MMARSPAVAVVGAGSWGTALALQIGRRGTPVRLWARDAALAASMTSMRENTRYLPGVRLPESVLATADHREALRDADLVILAMPSHFVQIVVPASEQRTAKALVGKRVRVTGTLFEAISGHHRTPLLVQVQKLAQVSKWQW